MRKAELADHHNQYLAKEAHIRDMVQQCDFPRAFAACGDSFAHVVPAMKYRRQAGITPEVPEFLCFSVICRYGPPLFEHGVLKSLNEFIGGTRQLARHENEYRSASETALEHEELARTFWNHLEYRPGLTRRELSERFNVPERTVAEIIDVWKEVGLVCCGTHGKDPQLFLGTRLDVDIVGVCQHCGTKGRGRKELFLQRIKCGKCTVVDYYHILFDEAR